MPEMTFGYRTLITRCVYLLFGCIVFYLWMYFMFFFGKLSLYYRQQLFSWIREETRGQN